MIERSRHSSRPWVVAAWTLIWFGTILSVNPRTLWSQFGAVLWGAGLLVQLVIVARWFIGRPASGKPVAHTKPRGVPARV
jgi:hypothetical protein